MILFSLQNSAQQEQSSNNLKLGPKQDGEVPSLSRSNSGQELKNKIRMSASSILEVTQKISDSLSMSNSGEELKNKIRMSASSIILEVPRKISDSLSMSNSGQELKNKIRMSASSIILDTPQKISDSLSISNSGQDLNKIIKKNAPVDIFDTPQKISDSFRTRNMKICSIENEAEQPNITIQKTNSVLRKTMEVSILDGKISSVNNEPKITYTSYENKITYTPYPSSILKKIKQMDVVIVKNRLKIQKDLSNIYYCLSEAVSNTNLELVVFDNCLFMQTEKKTKDQSSDDFNIFYIYSKILESINCDNYLFLNNLDLSSKSFTHKLSQPTPYEKLHILKSVKDIDKLIVKKYPFMNEAQQERRSKIIKTMEKYYIEHSDFIDKLMLFEERKYSDLSHLNKENNIKYSPIDYSDLKLSLPPTDLQNLNEDEIYFISTLQKIFPLSNPNFNANFPALPPHMFFLNFNEYCKEKKMVSPKILVEDKFVSKLKEIKSLAIKLVKHVNYLVNLPEETMPYMQKIILLNFYKSWLDNYELFKGFFRTWTPYMDIINENPDIPISNFFLEKEKLEIKILDQNRDYYIKMLCEEIAVLTHGAKCSCIENVDKQVSVIKFIDSYLINKYSLYSMSKRMDKLKKSTSGLKELLNRKEQKPHIKKNNEVNQFIDMFTSDTKIRAGQSYYYVTFDTCLSATAKFPHDVATFSRQISCFVYKSFIDILPQVELNPLLSEEDLINILLNSLENNFHLNVFNLNDLFTRIIVNSLKKNDFLTGMAIFSALNHNLITKLYDKSTKNLAKNESMQKKIQSLNKVTESLKNQIFDFKNGYQNLKEKMAECQKNKVFYIPSQALNSALDRRMENIRLLEGVEFVKEKAKYVKKYEEIFNDIRSHLENVKSDFRFKTDIAFQIQLNTADIDKYEEKFNIIAKWG